MDSERKQRWLVYLLGAACFFQNGLIGPIVARFADQHLGLSLATVGFVLAMRNFAPALFAAYIGTWVTRFGLRRSLGVTGLLTALTGGLYLIADSYILLMLAQVLGGLFYLGSWIGAQTYATGLPDRERVLGVFSTFTAIGMAVAPPLGGLAYDLGGYEAAFWVYIIGAAGQLLIVHQLADISMGTAAPKARAAKQPAQKGRFMTIMSRPGIQTAFLFSFVCLFAINARMTFIPVHFQQLGYSASFIGLILSAGSIGQAAVRPFTNAGLRLLGLTNLLVVSSALGIFGLFTLPFFSTTWIILVLAFLHGAGAGLHQSVGLVLVADHSTDDERGYAVGLRATVNQVSGTVAPALLGSMSQLWGLATSFSSIGVGMVGIIGLMAARARTTQKRGFVPEGQASPGDAAS